MAKSELYDRFADSAAASRRIDDYVAQPGKPHEIGDYTAKANLIPVSHGAYGNCRVPHGAIKSLESDALRPVALSDPTVYQCAINSVRIIGDQKFTNADLHSQSLLARFAPCEKVRPHLGDHWLITEYGGRGRLNRLDYRLGFNMILVRKIHDCRI